MFGLILAARCSNNRIQAAFEEGVNNITSLLSLINNGGTREGELGVMFQSTAS